MLNTVKLAQDLEQLQQSLSQMTDSDEAAKYSAQQTALILTEFVHSGQVQTTGTAAAQTGKVV